MQHCMFHLYKVLWCHKLHVVDAKTGIPAPPPHCQFALQPLSHTPGLDFTIFTHRTQRPARHVIHWSNLNFTNFPPPPKKKINRFTGPSHYKACWSSWKFTGWDRWTSIKIDPWPHCPICTW